MAVFAMMAFLIPMLVLAGLWEGGMYLADRLRERREWKYLRDKKYPVRMY